MAGKIFKFTLFIGVIMLSSCFNEKVSDRSGKRAFGKLSTLTVLADEQLWDSPVRDSFEYYYESAYPILPQPEPMFDLLHKTSKQLLSKPVNKQLRAFLILADLSDTSSHVTQMTIKDIGSLEISDSMGKKKYGVKSGKNKWAENQMLVYIYANSQAELIQGIIESFPSISNKFYLFDKDVLEANTFGGGQNILLQNLIREKYGIDIRIPNSWVKAVEKDDFLWLRNERIESSNSLMFYKTTYENVSQFSKSQAIGLRDEVSQQYIASTVEGSAMLVDSVNLPVFTYQKNFGENYGIELRGIWDMKKDFMGGPFATFLIQNLPKKEIILVDGFIYAPGEDKRDHMRAINHIIETIKVK